MRRGGNRRSDSRRIRSSSEFHERSEKYRLFRSSSSSGNDRRGRSCSPLFFPILSVDLSLVSFPFSDELLIPFLPGGGLLSTAFFIFSLAFEFLCLSFGLSRPSSSFLLLLAISLSGGLDCGGVGGRRSVWDIELRGS